MFTGKVVSIFRILTKTSASQGNISNLRLSDVLKLSSEQENLNKGMYL